MDNGRPLFVKRLLRLYLLACMVSLQAPLHSERESPRMTFVNLSLGAFLVSSSTGHVHVCFYASPCLAFLFFFFFLVLVSGCDPPSYTFPQDCQLVWLCLSSFNIYRTYLRAVVFPLSVFLFQVCFGSRWVLNMGKSEPACPFLSRDRIHVHP